MHYRILGVLGVALALVASRADAQDTAISGQVMRGDRVQPDIKVVLTKLKPNPGDKAKESKTNKDGAFEFVGVEPGEYVVTAERFESIASMRLVVPKSKAKIAEVKLVLKVK